VLAASFSREKTSPGLSWTSLASSSRGTMNWPDRSTLATVYFSPSLTLTVMKMSRRSGLIETWVDSIAKSR